jgi:hypothetical protein
VLYFLTRRLPDKDVSDIRKLILRRDLVESWKHLESDAKELSRKLTGKEAATPSRAWNLLSHTRPETVLFTEGTTRQQAVSQKIDNFFGKWRQVKEKLPLPEMAEMHITPALPEYPKLAEEAFLLLLDGKLRSRGEIVRFLKPYAPPPPPPPPPPRRGKGTKPEVAAVAPGRPGRKGGKVAAGSAPVPPVPPPVEKPAENPVAKRRGRPPGKTAKSNLPPAPPIEAKQVKPQPAEPARPAIKPAAKSKATKAEKKRSEPAKKRGRPKRSKESQPKNKKQKK